MTNPKQPTTPQAAAKDPNRPTFKEAPRYKLLEKAFFGEVSVRQGTDWMPYTDVLLNPEEQQIVGLSGAFGGRGTPQREPLLIEFTGIPDAHMEPINAAAEWMMDHIDELIKDAQGKAVVQRGRRGNRNPIDALTIVGPGAEVLQPVQDSV